MAEQHGTFFDVLGVPVTASSEEIHAAYYRLAKEFHPDRHPAASDLERSRLTEAMATINQAFATLRDDTSRRAYVLAMASAPPPPRPMRGPLADECALCGSFPAVDFTFQHQNAYLFRGTRYTNAARLCRDCGRSFGRSKQNRTLWTGWWGFPAIFTNLAVVYRNTANLNRARHMNYPQRRPDVVTPLNSPLSAGKPLFKRSGVLVTCVLVVLIGLGLAADQGTQSATTGGPTFPVSTATWSNGACVSTVGTSARPVPCSMSHNAVVVAAVSSVAQCPSTSNRYVVNAGRVYCISSSLYSN